MTKLINRFSNWFREINSAMRINYNISAKSSQIFGRSIVFIQRKIRGELCEKINSVSCNEFNERVYQVIGIRALHYD